VTGRFESRFWFEKYVLKGQDYQELKGAQKTINSTIMAVGKIWK